MFASIIWHKIVGDNSNQESEMAATAKAFKSGFSIIADSTESDEIASCVVVKTQFSNRGTFFVFKSIFGTP